MTEATLRWILIATAAELVLAAVLVLQWRLRAARAIGPKVREVAPTAGRRRAAALVPFVLALVPWLPFVATGVAYGLLSYAVLVLALGALVFLGSPAPHDRALGADGARSGWNAARFEDLTEWRLTGEHLRFRVEGRPWGSVEVAPDEREALRARLERFAPGRESRYSV